MVKKDKDILLIKCGAQTSVGADAEMSAAAFYANLDYLVMHEDFEDETWRPVTVSPIEYFEDEFQGAKRFVKILGPSLDEALSPIIDLKLGDNRVPVFLGIPENRPTLPGQLEETLLEAVKIKGHSLGLIFETNLIKTGHTSGLIGLEQAIKVLMEEETEFCLIAGVDSYIDSKTVKWLEREKRLKCSGNQWGFIPGEAAGACLLCLKKTAEKYDLRGALKILRVASAEEQTDFKDSQSISGKALAESMAEIVKGLPEKSDKIEQVYSTLNGERHHTEEYGFAIPGIANRFIDPANLITPNSAWGDIGAASGPLLLTLAAENGALDTFQSPFNLIYCSSMGSFRAAALIELL